MGKTALITGSFSVAWDIDDVRKEWDCPELSDSEVVEELRHTVEQNWDSYATTPDTIHIEVDLIG